MKKTKATKANVCGSVWNRGRTVMCSRPFGHKGLHKGNGHAGVITWRLPWEDTAIAKRERAAKSK